MTVSHRLNFVHFSVLHISYPNHVTLWRSNSIVTCSVAYKLSACPSLTACDFTLELQASMEQTRELGKLHNYKIKRLTTVDIQWQVRRVSECCVGSLPSQTCRQCCGESLPSCSFFVCLCYVQGVHSWQTMYNTASTDVSHQTKCKFKNQI